MELKPTFIKTSDKVFKESIDKAREERLKRAEEEKIGIKDVIDEIIELKRNGPPKGHKIPHKAYDHFKFTYGNVITITGYSGHGKSHFIEEIITMLISFHGMKFGFYAPERKVSYSYIRMMDMIRGVKIFNDIVTEDEIFQMAAFLNDKTMFVNSDKNRLNEEELMLFIEAFFILGCKGVLIDNVATIQKFMLDDKGGVGDFMNNLKELASEYNANIFLVVHPTKQPEVIKQFHGSKMAGPAEFYNLCDVNIVVFYDKSCGVSSANFCKIKDEFTGREGQFDYQRNDYNNRFYSGKEDNEPWINFVKNHKSNFDIPTVPIKEYDYDNEFDTPF